MRTPARVACLWPAQVWLHRVLQPLGRRRARPAAPARCRARVAREAAPLCAKQAGSVSLLAGEASFSARACSRLLRASAILDHSSLRPRWLAIIGLGFHTGCPRKRWTACVDRGTAASRDRTPRAKSLRASQTWVERSPSAMRGGRKSSGTRDAGSPSRLCRNRLTAPRCVPYRSVCCTVFGLAFS